MAELGMTSHRPWLTHIEVIKESRKYTERERFSRTGHDVRQIIVSKEAVSQRKRERDDGMGRLRVDHPRGYKTASGVELELGGGGDTLSKFAFC